MARSANLDRLNFRDTRCPLDSRIDVERLLALPYSNITQVNQMFELRPALMSFYAYQTPDYWWVLLDYNQLTWSQFTLGRIIKLPELPVLRELLRSSNLRLLAPATGSPNERYRLPRRTLVV